LESQPPAGSDIVAANVDLAGGRPNLAEHHTNSGALAGAIMPEQTIDLSCGDRQSEVIDSEVLCELFSDVDQLDHTGEETGNLKATEERGKRSK
jgi:hypothetical protein